MSFKEGMRFIAQLKAPMYAESFEREYNRRMARQKLLDEEKINDPLYSPESETLMHRNALWNQCNGILLEEERRKAALLAKHRKRKIKGKAGPRNHSSRGYGDALDKIEIKDVRSIKFSGNSDSSSSCSSSLPPEGKLKKKNYF